MLMRLATPGLLSTSKRTQRSVSESVTAFLNLRMMSSGRSSRYTVPLGSLSDLDILFSGEERLMTRAPTVGIYGSGILNTSP